MTSHHSLIILGAGPAGYTAAIYAARANLNPVLITGNQPGGQLMTTLEVGNWPGSPLDLQGPNLMELMKNQVEHLGVQLFDDHIQTAHLTQKPFALRGNKTYTCDALIIATGAQAKYLGLASESAFKGKGVSACATCDGFFYRNQTVAVVGGGNTAIEEALYLSGLAKETILIHRRDQFRAEKILQDRLFEKVKQGRIRLQLNSVVEEIVGDASGVTGIQLKTVNQTAPTYLAVQGVFIAIGHHPNTELFQGQLEMNQGYLVVGGKGLGASATSMPGIFAAGDVADPVYRQAITAAATGCMAALESERYLDNLSSLS